MAVMKQTSLVIREHLLVGAGNQKAHCSAHDVLSQDAGPRAEDVRVSNTESMTKS